MTSHSPDLLDSPRIETDSILAVEMVDGASRIARLDETGRSALKDRLYTPGELLRLGQLTPNPSEIPDPDSSQLKLFDQEDER